MNIVNKDRLDGVEYIFSATRYRPHIGGVENSLFYLAQAAKDRNIKSLIFCSDSSPIGCEVPDDYEYCDGIAVRRYRYWHRPALLAILSPIVLVASAYCGFKKLRQEVDPKRVTVVGRDQFVVMGASLAGFKRIGYMIPSISANLDNRKSSEGHWLKKGLLWFLRVCGVFQSSWIQKFALRKAVYNYVFSENMREQVGQLMGDTVYVLPEVVPPGIDGARFKRHIDSRNKLRHRYHVDNKFVFLCLGRLTEIKGYADVITAFALLPVSFRERSCVVIVGDGPCEGDLVRQVRECSLEKDIIFCGATIEPQMFYTMSDCFMMTSRYEAFGQTLIEAMASGLPVIAYRPNNEHILTASEEILKHRPNAFFCDYGIDQLAQTMKTVLEMDEGELRKICDLNSLGVVEEYDWKKTFDSVCKQQVSVP